MAEAWAYDPREVEWDAPACEVCGGERFETVTYDRSHPEYFRGGSEFLCESCGARYGRWSHRPLSGQEVERRYGH
jgi:hypothetical protein